MTTPIPTMLDTEAARLVADARPIVQLAEQLAGQHRTIEALARRYWRLCELARPRDRMAVELPEAVMQLGVVLELLRPTAAPLAGMQTITRDERRRTTDGTNEG